MTMSRKTDYSLKFFKGSMMTNNEENYNFYLIGRTLQDAYKTIENYVYAHKDRYHIIPDENDIEVISVKEVKIEDYGKLYGYEVIN